jgi:hypothetical protein
MTILPVDYFEQSMAGVIWRDLAILMTTNQKNRATITFFDIGATTRNQRKLLKIIIIP